MLELDKTLIVILFILVFAVAIFTTYYFSDKRRIIRTLKKLKNNNISNLKQNELAKITGKAINIHEPLRVPMSNRKCVYYKIKIEQEVGDDDSTSWKTLIEEEKIQDFFLEKNGEKIIIKLTKKPKNFLGHFVVDKEEN